MPSACSHSTAHDHGINDYLCACESLQAGECEPLAEEIKAQAIAGQRKSRRLHKLLLLTESTIPKRRQL